MRHYPSKLLLFGEHVLLLGSTALALPLSMFQGEWQETDDIMPNALSKQMLRFAESRQLAQIKNLDVQAFQREIGFGLKFESNIPMGYGLGSSGALCAGVYDRFCSKKTTDLTQLKSIFAKMEGFFHGASSGIDPLTSYLQQPLLIRHKTSVSVPVMQPWARPPVICLIDSALPRQTGPLVQWFLAQQEERDFARLLKRDLLPAHEAMVQGWLDANADVFWPNLRRVSQFQLENMSPMIPETLRTMWMESFEQQDIVFKICGAGGGGFMLGFSQSKAAFQALAPRFNLLFPFQS